MLHTPRLSRALNFSLVLSVATALPSVPAFAEDVAMEEVVVTGSRIKRSDLSSISPITVLSEEDLETSGNLTLEDFLQDLPSVNGGDFGSSVNNGNPGLATVSLRGLGPSRTLVLLNGHRPAAAATDGIIDLNMIPTAIVERVEVLRDGAATAYGSDAIAGVVNIITKRDFEGLEIDVGYDVSDEDDGEQYSAALTWGNTFDRGNFVVSAQYTKRADIFQRDRGFANCPLDENANGKFCGGSGTTTPGQFTPQVTGGGRVVDATTGLSRPFDSSRDAFNFAEVSYLSTPQDIISLYTSTNYLLFEDSPLGAVNSSLEASFSNRTSDQLLAPVGTFWQPVVPTTNPFNPFGDALCAGDPACAAPEGVAVTRRLTESGGRAFTQDVNTWRIAFGLDGEFDNGIEWDVSYNYARWDDSQRDEGRAVRPRIDEMLDPAACAASTIGCPGVWNPFASNTMTTAQVAFGFVGVNTKEESTMRILQGNVRGDIPGFELPGGPIAWAAGYEHRRESAASLPDGGAALNAIFATPGLPTEGSYNVDEAYLEVSLPLLSDIPGAEVLTLEGAVRWSDYNFVSGSDTTYKVGFEWAPINDVRVRASFTEGFRAPNITELFLGQQQTAAAYTDPCDNWGGNTNANIQANCAADGLANNVTIDAPQATSLEGGNANLEPEESETLTVGLVITPRFLENLSITVDYYDIEIEQAVGSAGTGNIINSCYGSANFSDPLCAFIVGPAFPGVDETPSVNAPTRRNAINQISGVLLTTANLSNFETSGFDFAINYGFDTDFGRIDLRAVGTHIDEYTFTAFDGGAPVDLAGNFGIDPYQGDNVAAFPDWQVNYYASLVRDDWGASVVAKWLDSTDDVNGAAGNLENTADSIIYWDVQGYYSLSENATVTLGIRNLTDEEPPYVTNYDDINTIHFSYDTAGRYAYGRVTLKL